MNRRNYYRVLHVEPDAPKAVVQASYRALMQRLKMHPDLGGDHDEAALINEAYAVLSDPARRAAYDLTLEDAAERRRHEPAATASGTTPSPPRESTPVSTCPFCETPCPVLRAEDPDGVCTVCGSALASAPRHLASDASRRAFERVSRAMPLTFHRAASREVSRAGSTEDFSLNGMRLLSPVALAPGERVRIECGFCSVVAVVRSATPEGSGRRRGWHCGVEFLTLRLKRERGGLISTAG
jgi:curved DNA-binding protein CbpA